MKSTIDDAFIACFRRLPDRVKGQAKKSYRLWKRDPFHPGLQFKQVCRTPAVYSVRVGLGWRALGLMEDGAIQWFWIGSHAKYDHLLKNM